MSSKFVGELQIKPVDGIRFKVGDKTLESRTEAVLYFLGRKQITYREYSVLARVTRGMNPRDMAFDLNVSPKTIESHLANLRRKTRTHSMVELILWALHSGLFQVSPEPEEEPVTLKQYSLCERVSPDPYGKWHIRVLTYAGKKLGGGADTKALCGVAIAWDLDFDVDASHFPEICPRCLEEFRAKGCPGMKAI